MLSAGEILAAQQAAAASPDRRWAARAIGEMFEAMIHVGGGTGAGLPRLDARGVTAQLDYYAAQGLLLNYKPAKDATFELGAGLGMWAGSLFTWLNLMCLHDMQVTGMTDGRLSAQEDCILYVVTTTQSGPSSATGLSQAGSDIGARTVPPAGAQYAAGNPGRGRVRASPAGAGPSRGHVCRDGRFGYRDPDAWTVIRSRDRPPGAAAAEGQGASVDSHPSHPGGRPGRVGAARSRPRAGGRARGGPRGAGDRGGWARGPTSSATTVGKDGPMRVISRRSERRRAIAARAGLVALAPRWASASFSRPRPSAEISNGCQATVAGVSVGDRSSTDPEQAIKVQADQDVTVVFTAPAPITGYKVELEYAGFRFPVAQGVTNGNSWTQTVAVKDYAKFGVGLYKVIGSSTGPGACSASFLIGVVGKDPLSTLIGAFSAAILAIGALATVAITAGSAMGGPWGADNQYMRDLRRVETNKLPVAAIEPYMVMPEGIGPVTEVIDRIQPYQDPVTGIADPVMPEVMDHAVGMADPVMEPPVTDVQEIF